MGKEAVQPVEHRVDVCRRKQWCMLVSAFAWGARHAMWLALVDAAQVWNECSER